MFLYIYPVNEMGKRSCKNLTNLYIKQTDCTFHGLIKKLHISCIGHFHVWNVTYTPISVNKDDLIKTKIFELYTNIFELKMILFII